MKRAIPLLAAILLAGWLQAQPVDLVTGGESAYVIYHDADAPSHVATAARELQKYVEEVSGARLEIVPEPAEPMVCLGENDASRAAGVDLDDVPLEGFRIVTDDGNVYILGPDTPAGARTPGGGTSTGTRNGAHDFIERFLGVRWLMPGEQGDYVPTSPDITIPETDLTDAPYFLNRRVPYIQERRPETKVWIARQKLGWSLYLNHGHNWRRPIPATHFDDHPEWFAMRGGVRVPATGRYKLCTTNQEMVREFADVAIRYFDENPAASCFSLSPSDSAGWCECEPCSALYETDPNGNLSVTPAILTFYNDIAKLVAEEHPEKILAGYVYASYVFPPHEPIRLEPNVFLVWAPSFDYGFTLYRPALQKQWDDLVAQWTEVTENISYYDLPNCVHNEAGAPNPPGIKILEFLYPRLKQAKMKGVYVYGTHAWGHAGPMNYLLAKLAWDPEADIDALFEDYCETAYAEGADEMKAFYRLLDDETQKYFIEHEEERYVLSTGRMRDLYAAQFPEMERLYRAAEAKITDPDALTRLEMMGDNLTLLHWTMRQYKLVDDENSSFYLTDADLFAFLNDNRGSLAMTPSVAAGKPAFIDGEFITDAGDPVPNADPIGRFLLRGDQHVVLRPTGDGPIEIRFRSLTARGKLVTYSTYNEAGDEIGAGIVSTEIPITIKPDGSQHYHLAVKAGSASYAMAVNGARWALNGRLSDKGLWLLGATSPLYFEVADGVESFHLQLQATPPGETALATLYSPTGREVANFDCTQMSVDRQLIAVEGGEAGTWKLVIEKADVRVIDDVNIMQGEQLSGYFVIAPEQALSVTPVD